MRTRTYHAEGEGHPTRKPPLFPLEKTLFVVRTLKKKPCCVHSKKKLSLYLLKNNMVLVGWLVGWLGVGCVLFCVVLCCCVLDVLCCSVLFCVVLCVCVLGRSVRPSGDVLAKFLCSW